MVRYGTQSVAGYGTVKRVLSLALSTLLCYHTVSHSTQHIAPNTQMLIAPYGEYGAILYGAYGGILCDMELSRVRYGTIR